MAENVFVLGLDERNHELMRRLSRRRYRFHSLLSKQQLMGREVSLAELLALAGARLESFDGSIDAIVGYWDFPVSSMVPILSSRFRLHSAGLEPVLKCEHKYWSRLVQRQVTEACPPFALIDPGSPQPPAGLSYPMWVKPVKASSSMHAYKVDGPEEFALAVKKIEQGSREVGAALDAVLSRVRPPHEIVEIGGQACVAEEALEGRQITVEGYCCRGRVRVYGLVDSITYPDRPSFLRYQYPSTLPEPVARRLVDITTRVVERIGLDSCAFNVEYFWDARRDRVNLLEINPRISQSHARLFEHVDGRTNHDCMVRVALGRDPAMPHRQGRYPVAAKWFVRRFSDGVVRRCPSPEEIAHVERSAPGVVVHLTVRDGSRLSDLLGQDSYSYRLAEIDVGGRDEAELIEKYQRCIRLLHFEFDE
jgi:hypothetical protein